jgi:hypothetical protein
MRFAVLLCAPALVGAVPARAGATRSVTAPRAPSPSATVPAQTPGLPYVAVPPAAPTPQRPASWDQVFQRNPGLKERVEALKKAHPEVKDWKSLFTMPGRPPTVSDLYLQFPDLRDFLSPIDPKPDGTPRFRIILRDGKPPEVITLPYDGPFQQPIYRPEDRALFKHAHPLLTPATPVHLNELATPEPGNLGIVELPAP